MTIIFLKSHNPGGYLPGDIAEDHENAAYLVRCKIAEVMTPLHKVKPVVKEYYAGEGIGVEHLEYYAGEGIGVEHLEVVKPAAVKQTRKQSK